jgi:hypothetical protein
MSATRHRMSFAEYRALPHANWSGLETYRASSRVYAGRRDGSLSDRKETAGLRLGTLFHLATLEPALYERTVTVEPTTDDDFTGTGAKARREAWKALLTSWHEALPDDMIVADPADVLTVSGMVHSLRTLQTPAASVARRLLFGAGESEVTVTWDDGALCKARLDRLIERGADTVADRLATVCDDDIERQVQPFGHVLEELA